MQWPRFRRLPFVFLAFAACTVPPLAAPEGGDAGIVADSGPSESPGASEAIDAGSSEDAGEEIVDAGLDAGVEETPDAGLETPDAGPVQDPDLDGDGLSDEWEEIIAREYLPFLSLAPDDACTRGGIVYRVRPHPKDKALIAITYDHLFETDCGLNGHTGDNEAFGVTIDPRRPSPQGITAIVAISHQNTLCQRVTKCGLCNGLTACDTAMTNGYPTPVVYSSKDKHGSYVTLAGSLNSCNLGSCLDQCTLAPASASPPLVNAGEPNAHLVEDLTTQGFITAANGWTKTELLNFPLWDPKKTFGSAGNVAGDLEDTAFEAEPCAAP
jgi:hypothetical protein